MNISGVFQREKRHPNQMYHPMHHSVANYWTEAFQKREMKHNFTDELFLNNIHMIPDPLKKNLADSLFNTESGKKPEKMYNQNENVEQSVPKAPKQTTLGGIGSFFSGVMNVLTNVMFRSRETNYYDCFDVDSQAQAWQQAKADVQDKNGQTSGRRNNDAAANPNASPEMNLDSRQAVTGCERKLNEVLHLLTPKQTSSPVWVRKRPKKVFVEPGSVEENFQDAFSPEDFCSLQNDSFIEYYSPMQYQCEELCETAAQKTKLNMAPVEKTKLNMAPVEKTEIIKDTPKTILENKKDETKQNNNEMEQKMQLGKDYVPKENDNMPTHQQKMPDKATLNMEHQEMEIKTDETEKSVPESPNIKNQLVSSCEDKLSRLKALLQEKRLKCRTSVKCEPESKTLPNIEAKETKMADKRFKNPNRRCAKRTKSKTKNRIEDDLIFANEISIGTPPSAENSPMQHTVSFGDYFDEVSGRFRTTSTGSDDSFQIVFNEYPTGRLRKSSDCDSEDSFIVFEDSPDNCFVSNDVFDSDSESEMSDSGFDVTFQLAHSLTRTVSNLADDSLYVGEDEVDCAMVSPGANVTVKPFAVETPEDFVSKTPEDSKKNTGLILDEKKKQLRKSQPSKQVRFSSDPPKVHVMRVWAFAARQARAGHWERFAVDRERFKRRIADADMALSWVLKPQHRSRVMFQRFMPWWNQLKRKELAERKAKEEEEKRRTEEDKRKAEEEKQKAEEERRREEEKTKEEVKSVQEKQNLEDTTPQKQNNEDSKSANNVNLNEQGNVSEQINDTSNLGDLNNKIGSGKENLQQLKDIPLEGNQETISQSIIESKTNIRPKDNEVVNTQNGSVQVTVTEDSNNIFLITDNGKISNLIIDDALAKKLQDLEADDSNRKLIRS